MKLFCFTVIVFLTGVILPFNYGLRCYECISEEGFENQGAATYHKKCKEGSLPNSLGVDCTTYNLRHPKTLKLLTPQTIPVKGNITWMCTKLEGKVEGKDVTVKGCYGASGNSEPSDRCSDEVDELGSPLKYCDCFSDLCNGSNPKAGLSLSAVMIIGISVVATYLY